MKNRRPLQNFFPEAIRQIRTGWIPALLAVVAATGIARLGALVFAGLLALAVLAGVVIRRRYRIVFERRTRSP